MMRIVWRLAVLVFFTWPSVGESHSGSASYFRVVNSDDDDISLSVSLDVRDLEYAIGIDANGNGEITWGELRNQRAGLQAYVLERLHLRRGSNVCAPSLNELAVEEVAGNVYAVMSGALECAGSDAFELKSDLFFDLDVAHRALVEWQHRDGTTLAVLTNERREARESVEAGAFAQLASFGLQGMLHIWSGFDHLAFLLVLLLPAFMSASGAGIAWRKLLSIITAFTIAHSLTLALSVAGVVSLPERPVEIAIATSVIIAALTNLFPRTHSIGAWTAFGFGLLHGFGFAAALEGLGATERSFATALAGFNLGVEVGQLLVVAAALPVALWMRRHPPYATRLVPIASVGVAVLGSLWVCQRIVS